MLKVKNLVKYYGSELILNKLSFNLEKEHKVALVGFNGTGKTTLLKIIAGIEDFDNGKVEKHKNLTISFLPQDPKKYNKQNVLTYLEKSTGLSGELFYRNVQIMFDGFGLDNNFIQNSKIENLSSGQKTKVFLTAVLLKKSDLVLLDEPTNNLDLPALIWLEDYLNKTKSSFIVVSHDRIFLDNISNKIYELDWDKRDLKISNGKYSDYLIRKKQEQDRLLHEYQLEQDEIKRLASLAENKIKKGIEGSKWKGNDNDKMLIGFKRNRAGTSMKDSRIIFNKIKRMKTKEQPVFRKNFQIDFNVEDDGKSKDILIQDLICGYKNDFEIGPINLDIRHGNRICILGLNGTGKSTLLKTITKNIPHVKGKLDIDEGVIFGNFMQEHESLSTNDTLVNFLIKKTKTSKNLIYNYLFKAGFNEWQMNNKIKDLSPGGKARLLFVYFILKKVNVLILDEPTNHLDLEIEEALEEALKSFKGTIILVTHNRFLIQNIKMDNFYVMEDKKLNKISDFETYTSEMKEKSKKLLRMLK